MSASGNYAYLHMSLPVFQMLKSYCAIMKTDDTNANEQFVFRHGADEACHSIINRWLKRAWKK
ncbi:hypothetical protein DPMN_092583 [Dreissena polymorpha]|uniref:Uncharacterized protein n=1 Tax=Dreissena polymorpha TaxID=45954 RepID=A0A9D4L1M0_DREPO|nr:hypothetical protein DPMN_092583 [Dreissena polymorpha]